MWMHSMIMWPSGSKHFSISPITDFTGSWSFEVLVQPQTQKHVNLTHFSPQENKSELGHEKKLAWLLVRASPEKGAQAQVVSAVISCW